MILLSRRSLLGIAAVVDIAMHARPGPVPAKLLAARHNLPPRHLETLLQGLVRADILKGVRGPRGGYELATERRRITAGDIVRAAMQSAGDDGIPPLPESRLVDVVVGPAVARAGEAFLHSLDQLTVEDLCRRAEERGVFSGHSAMVSTAALADFTI
jgi:Rrf2 family protein